MLWNLPNSPEQPDLILMLALLWGEAWIRQPPESGFPDQPVLGLYDTTDYISIKSNATYVMLDTYC